jgi:hypothetical protein
MFAADIAATTAKIDGQRAPLQEAVVSYRAPAAIPCRARSPIRAGSCRRKSRSRLKKERGQSLLLTLLLSIAAAPVKYCFTIRGEAVKSGGWRFRKKFRGGSKALELRK